MARILVIEDENDLRELLEYNLKGAGYEVFAASDAAAGFALAQEHRPDLVLLDIMLPDASGLDVCRMLRSNPATRDAQVMMVTAKGEEIDRVVGFEVGADDYVVKPFSVRELLLRVRARLQELAARVGGKPIGAATTQPRRLTVGALTIDADSHLVSVEDREIAVSLLEMQLLLHLAQAQGSVCSRRDLLTHVWKYSPGVTSRTVDTHVKRLRDKLGTAGHLIRTIRGVGYRLAS